MTFNPNIPQPTDLLADSQGQFLTNNQTLDNNFGVDHYKFSNVSGNSGKHNQVTTPLIVGSAHPATAANEPKFYAMQDTAQTGVLQYSRGGNNAVPSPVTYLQSPSTPIILGPGAVTNILDCTNITFLLCSLYAANIPGGANKTIFIEADILWNKAPVTFRRVQSQNPTNDLDIQFSTSIIQIKNTSGTVTYNDIYWTLVCYRIKI